MNLFGWPFDSSQAVWRLIFSGLFDRFPSVRVVMHHMGAMFPYLVGRVELGMTRVGKKLGRDF